MNSDSAFFPDAVIPVYDETGKAIETREHAGEYKEGLVQFFPTCLSPAKRARQRLKAAEVGPTAAQCSLRDCLLTTCKIRKILLDLRTRS
jgi:hypothetical protein